MSGIESGVSVNDISDLALPTGTVLAGGQTGLSNAVSWVASLRAAFPLFSSPVTGYIVLARLELIRNLDPRLTCRYLIEELALVQASALVTDEPTSAEDAKLADRLGLPVFWLPKGTDVHQVERDALRTLLDRDGQRAQRALQARQQLLQAFDRGGLDAVLGELSRVTEADLHVYDEAETLVSQMETRPDQRPHATNFPVRIAGRELGRLELRTERARPSTLARIYAEQAAEVCGIEMLQILARKETEERLGLDLVEQLLNTNQDPASVISRFQRLGYELSSTENHVVLAIGSPKREATSRCETLARDFEWAVRRDGAKTLITKFREHVLLFCGFDRDTPDRRVRDWVRQVFAPASQECTVGVSRIVGDLGGLREAVQQALNAWELGHAIRDRQSPYAYDDLGLYRLLAGLRESAELRLFYDEILGPLVAYDKTHDTELVLTLQVFFAENTNASSASRALFVHRNTLNYRLQRIVEITNLDLNDPEARLALQLALKIHHIKR